jgi:hypothetical protein
MAASSPPSKKKAEKYAATSWGAEHLTDLEMPSGQLAQVRRPGITGLIKAGLLDSLDSLTALVKTEHIDRVEKGKPTTPEITAEDIRALAQDKDKLIETLDLMDRVVEYVVVQPVVLRPVERDEQGNPLKMWKGRLDDNGDQIMEEIPIPDDKRVAGQVYTEMVDASDKIFIFQFVVGGVRDLEQFRQEFGETLGSLESL